MPRRRDLESLTWMIPFVYRPPPCMHGHARTSPHYLYYTHVALKLDTAWLI